MSESTFPFGAPADDQHAFEVEGSADSRKPLLLVGGVVGALVLGAGAFLLLGGGGEEASFTAAPRKAPAAAAPAVPEAVAVVPAASTEVVGRNPFKARYVEPKVDPAPAPSVVPPAAPAQPLPPLQVLVQQPPPAPPAPAPAPQPAAPAEYPITLKSVQPTGPSGITWTWTIGTKDVEVFQAQRFGQYGELVVLALESAEDGPRAVLQVGDATPIRVKVGETVNVL